MCEILPRDHDEIRVAVQIEVLKPVVEHVDGATKVVLGQASGEIPAAGREHRNAVEATRKHERLVAGAIEICADAARVAHDDHAVRRVAPPVAATEDRRPFAARAQPFGDKGGHWRFGTPASREIADADHWT
jgi:hypothetical protein